MTKQSEVKVSKKVEFVAALPPLSPTDPAKRTAKLLDICVELLELCVECTGTIDTAAAWLVNHAKDEVTLSTWGVRKERPY